MSGVLGLLGTLAIRLGIVAAGRASARDPFATFRQQRRGMGARQVLPDRVEEGRSRMPSLPRVDATGKDTSQHGLSPP